MLIVNFSTYGGNINLGPKNSVLGRSVGRQVGVFRFVQANLVADPTINGADAALTANKSTSIVYVTGLLILSSC